MSVYNTPEITKDVFAVGSKDWNLQIFDGFVPTPHGTSYNSYLVKGNGMSALVDTVAPGFENELIGKLNQLIDVSKLKYVIMNHAEPDHATGIPAVLKLCDAKLMTTEKGAGMASRFYGVASDRICVIKDGDSIDVGGRVLKFIETPWIHWPETMMTYLADEKVLFSGDFFGSHLAQGTFDEDIDDHMHSVKSYYGEIMMALRIFAKKAMDKLQGLDVGMIAPTHGVVFKNPKDVLENYRRWTNGETKPKAVIAYITMWKSTELLAKAMYNSLLSHGVETKIFNVLQGDFYDLAAEIVDSRAIVIGTPTVLSNMHPGALNAMNIVKTLKPPVKYGAVLNSFGWGKGAVKTATEYFDAMKVENVGAVEVNGPPLEDDYKKVDELAAQLSAKILAG